MLAHDVPITLGALGAWTAFEPDLLIALVAANLDFRRNFEAPVRDRPPGRDRDNRGDRRGSFPPFLFGPFLFFCEKRKTKELYIYMEQTEEHLDQRVI